jgi:hypothetical protein
LETNQILKTALEFSAQGLVVVRAAQDGSKAPLGRWKTYQEVRPTEEIIRSWFSDGYGGLGVLTGACSGHLEMFELEARATKDGTARELIQALRDHGYGELWDRISNGYSELSPSGGIHVLYTVADGKAAKNTKLAMRPATDNELSESPQAKEYVLIETRGEGGFTVTAPSNGKTHPSGNPWKLVRGGPNTIARITAKERDALYAISRLCDKMPHLELADPPSLKSMLNRQPDLSAPGSDFDERGDWHDILEPHGWVWQFRTAEADHWTRPGKDEGTSATTGYGDRGDYLYVFSTSTDLPQQRGMSKFAAYTYLNHDGDFTASANELRSRGFGSRDSSPALSEEQKKATVRGFSERLLGGGSFVLDVPSHPPAIWGIDSEVLWSEGEPCMLTGPTGVGKTTLGGQLVAGRIGLIKEVLGYPVKQSSRVLYLAMDRPSQIRRALRRLFGSVDRSLLEERLVAWQGPPPADLAKNPELLFRLAEAAGADTVVIDSLKDAAGGLSSEETGQGVNKAFQYCVAQGVEVLAYHHQTKHGVLGSAPKTIEDVYGSGWLTAGLGSVILLWGAPGDLVVELRHLKQPAEVVGPMKLLHDHETGTTTVFESVEEIELITGRPRSILELASRMYGMDPADTDVARVERKLKGLVSRGLAKKIEGDSGSLFVAIQKPAGETTNEL